MIACPIICTRIKGVQHTPKFCKEQTDPSIRGVSHRNSIIVISPVNTEETQQTIKISSMYTHICTISSQCSRNNANTRSIFIVCRKSEMLLYLLFSISHVYLILFFYSSLKVQVDHCLFGEDSFIYLLIG